jgi:basic amino acid/polyamine antiporter, APA family
LNEGSSSSGAKSIPLLTATFIVISNMIGTGIFTSLGYQVGGLPSGFVILFLWLIGGICAFCGAVSYAELAAALPRSGGEYHFLSRTYHPAVGFVSGFLSVTVGFAAPIALAAMAFAKYFADFTPGASPLLVSIAIATLATAVHLRSVIFGARFQNVATIFKLSLILIFIGAGLFASAHVEPLTFLPKPGDSQLVTSAPFAISLVYVMYSYTGWNASTYIIGEVRDPSRNIPLSAAIGSSLVTLLYLALNAVFLHVAPLEALERGKPDVGHVAAQYIFGENGGHIMAGLICIGLVSSISAMTWIGPRVAMAMGEDCHTLRFLGQKNVNGVPSRAILLQFVIVVALLISASFEMVLTYVQFSLSLCSFLTVLGVIVLRWRRPDLARPYKAWGYPVTPILFLVITGWMLVFLLKSKPQESLAGLATLLIGLLVYFLSPTRPQSESA